MDDDPVNHSINSNLDKHHQYRKYSPENIMKLRILYILAIVAWIVFCYVFELYKTDVWGILILAIPIVVFMFNFINVPDLNIFAENNTNAFAFFSIGLLVVFPLITLVRCSYKGNREKVVEVLVIALIFAVLSILTIWVRQSWISILRHLKSVFQTYSLVLLVYALYIYYRGSICHKENIIHPDIHPDIQKIELERIYPGISKQGYMYGSGFTNGYSNGYSNESNGYSNGYNNVCSNVCII